jgi:hypothetical protein
MLRITQHDNSGPDPINTEAFEPAEKRRFSHETHESHEIQRGNTIMMLGRNQHSRANESEVGVIHHPLLS